MAASALRLLAAVVAATAGGAALPETSGAGPAARLVEMGTPA